MKNQPSKPVPEKKSFKCMSDSAVINVGSVVAVYLPKYPEFPQIGKIQSSSDATITISWYDGAFNDVWNIVKLKKGIEWKETMNKDTILLYDLQFSRGQRLKKDAIEFLRDYYGKFVST